MQNKERVIKQFHEKTENSNKNTLIDMRFVVSHSSVRLEF